MIPRRPRVRRLLLLGGGIGYLGALGIQVLPMQTLAVPTLLGLGYGLTVVFPVSFTRRGWSVLVVAGTALFMALLYGPRSLESLIVPLVLGIVAAAISVSRVDDPNYRRIVPENGHVGESRTVRLAFDVDAPEAGVVSDKIGDGLSSTTNTVEATIGNEPVAYEITYEHRGVHTVGPLTVWVEDVLGLAARKIEYPEVDHVVAYPRVRPLTGATRRELNLLAGAAPERQRDEFHRLREYTTGDTLRDVHWKSSAKQPDDDLVVKEFVAEDQFGDVTIHAQAPESLADELAEATASIAVSLLNRGIRVGVTVGDGSVPPSIGADHRARLLELLARTDAGPIHRHVPGQPEVKLVGEDGGVTVQMGDYRTTFAALAGDTDRHEPPPVGAVAHQPEVRS